MAQQYEKNFILMVPDKIFTFSSPLIILTHYYTITGNAFKYFISIFGDY